MPETFVYNWNPTSRSDFFISNYQFPAFLNSKYDVRESRYKIEYLYLTVDWQMRNGTEIYCIY